jgi:hypothetical protein
VSVLAVAGASTVAAKPVVVTGGQTSVALADDFAAQTGLTLSGTSDEVIAPGALPGSVAFTINGRADPDRPTTLAYDSSAPAATVAGSLEHRGVLRFNNDSVAVGDFSIAVTSTVFDTGALVSDTVTPLGGLFWAVAEADETTATDSFAQIRGDLLVTTAFANFLETQGLVAPGAALAGTDLGDFQIDATVVPLPGAAVLLGTAVVGLAAARARRRRAATAG